MLKVTTEDCRRECNPRHHYTQCGCSVHPTLQRGDGDWTDLRTDRTWPTLNEALADPELTRVVKEVHVEYPDESTVRADVLAVLTGDEPVAAFARLLEVADVFGGRPLLEAWAALGYERPVSPYELRYSSVRRPRNVLA